MNYLGLTKEEYISLLKQCGMCTKKWTYAKWKKFNKKRIEIIKVKQKKKGLFSKLWRRIMTELEKFIYHLMYEGRKKKK